MRFCFQSRVWGGREGTRLIWGGFKRSTEEITKLEDEVLRLRPGAKFERGVAKEEVEVEK